MKIIRDPEQLDFVIMVLFKPGIKMHLGRSDHKHLSNSHFSSAVSFLPACHGVGV